MGVFDDSFTLFTQLYKLSGGNQVDGLPPAASFSSNELINQKFGWSKVCHVGGEKLKNFKKMRKCRKLSSRNPIGVLLSDCEHSYFHFHGFQALAVP